jgi:hypothetical protein
MLVGIRLRVLVMGDAAGAQRSRRGSAAGASGAWSSTALRAFGRGTSPLVESPSIVGST